MYPPLRSKLTMTGLQIRAIARLFRDNQRASAALEFAMVAPIFIALLFAIIELALVFFAGQLLETATQDAARLIMTGQAQTAASGGMTRDQFKQQVCDRLVAMFDCTNNLSIDVQSFTSFASIDPTQLNPIDSSQNLKTNFVFNMGGPNQTVLVRVFYPWQLFVTGLGFNIANLAGGKYLLQSSAAFRVEPFPQ